MSLKRRPPKRRTRKRTRKRRRKRTRRPKRLRRKKRRRIRRSPKRRWNQVMKMTQMTDLFSLSILILHPINKPYPPYQLLFIYHY
jgi:ribosomal protein L18